jgi:two-component system invasion response regulator UvrY
MIRVLIADDHSIVRQGLKQILEETDDLSVEGEASNGNEAMQKIRDMEWDVVLMDVSMPGKNGIETLKEIRQEKPDLPVLILSMYPEDQYAIRLIRAGASGYLTKESAPEQLVAAIRTVSQGRKYISPSVAELLALEIGSKSDRPPHEQLSNREDQIFRMIALGKTVSQIAEELKLSVKTASTYRTRILEKMHMKTNAELTHYAIRNGLVD